MFERIRSLPTRTAVHMASMLGMSLMCAETELTVKHFIPDGSGGYKLAPHPNKWMAMLGFHDTRKGYKCVTDAFVAFVVDQLQTETSVFGDFKYHDSGTGTAAEAAADTGLGTPCAEARDAGSQTEGATANIYKSVATHTYAGTFAITEHGLFNTTNTATLMDRTKFDAVNVVSGEKIEFTFQMTFTSGG